MKSCDINRLSWFGIKDISYKRIHHLKANRTMAPWTMGRYCIKQKKKHKTCTAKGRDKYNWNYKKVGVNAPGTLNTGNLIPYRNVSSKFKRCFPNSQWKLNYKLMEHTWLFQRISYSSRSQDWNTLCRRLEEYCQTQTESKRRLYSPHFYPWTE
jgi:hypothetical protein